MWRGGGRGVKKGGGRNLLQGCMLLGSLARSQIGILLYLLYVTYVIFVLFQYRSALQSLNKEVKIANDKLYIPGGLTHTWVGFYEVKKSKDYQIISEW